MKNSEKTKEQLITEIAELQKRNKELEISDIARMQKEQILRESETKYRLLVESSTDMLFTVDLKGRFLFVNNAFKKCLGYSKKEMMKINGFALVHPDDLYELKKQFAQFSAGKSLDNIEYRYKTKSGKYIHILNNATPISDSEGNIVAALGIARDISYRKKIEEELQNAHDELEHRVAVRTAELLKLNEKLNKEIIDRKRIEKALRESEEKYRAIFESFHDVYYRTDKEGLVTIISPSVRTHAGYDPEDIIGHPVTDFYLNPEDRETFIQKLKKKGAVNDYELKLKAKDGSVIETSMSAHIIFGNDGEPAGVEGVLRDITERKRAEEALKESEEKYRELVENLTEVIYALKPSGEVLYVSPAVKSLIGYSPKEIEGQSFTGLIHEDDLPLASERIQKILSGASVTGEYRIRAKTGQIRWISTTSRPIFKGKRAVGIQGILTDITERKKTEETMQFMQFSIDRAADAAFWMGKDARFIYVNDAACRSLGYSRKELLKMSVHDIDPDFPAEVWPDHWKDVKKRGSFSLESHHRTKKGRVFPVEVTVNYLEFGGKEYNCAFVKDITERKQAEEALRENEERFRTIVETAPGMLMISDTQGNNIYVSPNCEKLTGYTQEELQGTMKWWVHKDDTLKARKIFEQTFRKGKGGKDFEYKAVKKNGDIWYASSTWEPLRDKEENLLGIVMQTVDITERKRTEEELQAREAYLDQLFESAQEAIVMADNKGRALRINQEFTGLFGYTQEEAVGKVLDELIAPKKLQKSATLITEKVTKGERTAFEAIRCRRDGQMIAVSVLASPIVIGGKQVGTYGIYRNITERKKAEEQIKASLKEKEILLQEVHHRVKNNMQIISSLLNLQSRHVKDEESLGLFKSSQNRVKSMALIHERLYQSKDFSRIDVADYVQNLTNHLFITYGISKDAVKLKINIQDIFLDINTAIPCALIINELVSNSLKHAFPNGKKGMIKISMRPLGKREMELVVGDNGVGMPEDANLKNTKSLGLYLVSMLAEDQLHGEIKLDKTEGMAFRFRLRVKK